MVTAPPVAVPHWTLASRVGFRFLFIYILLYSLLTQLLTDLVPIPNLEIPDLSTRWPIRPIVLWTAVHILRVPRPPYADTGSGDKMFDWTLIFCLLVFAAIATIAWSVLDRNSTNYITLYKWLRFGVRIVLVSQMFGYGLAKIIPMQMPFPNPTRLLTPYGTFSPMGVLWTSIGSAPAYEIFAGSAELLAGILILVPRTTTLGALVCMADMTNTFLLNMTYDVPVKLLSFQLFLMAFFLASPELPCLINFFFLNRTAPPSSEPPLFSTLRANRIALAAQLLFGLSLSFRTRTPRTPSQSSSASLAPGLRFTAFGMLSNSLSTASFARRSLTTLAAGAASFRHPYARYLPAHRRFLRTLRRERQCRRQYSHHHERLGQKLESQFLHCLPRLRPTDP